jgi:hypothetical protein
LIQVLDGPLSDQVHGTKGTNQQIVGWNPQDWTFTPRLSSRKAVCGCAAHHKKAQCKQAAA